MSPEPENDRSSTARAYVLASQITTLGLEVALPVAGGYWLDQQWGTRPWLLIGGAVLGIAVFGVSVMQLVDSETKRKKSSSKPEPKSE